jgi:hypothetical protein
MLPIRKQLVFPPTDVLGDGESVRVAAKRQQDLFKSQDVYKEKMTSIQIIVAKEIKVVDMEMATKIKVVFLLDSSDSEFNYCLIYRRWS